VAPASAPKTARVVQSTSSSSSARLDGDGDDDDDDDEDKGDGKGDDPQAHLPPADRIVCPRDVVAFTDEDESIYVVGTRGGKVTRISGLEGMTRIKVPAHSPSSQPALRT